MLILPCLGAASAWEGSPTLEGCECCSECRVDTSTWQHEDFESAHATETQQWMTCHEPQTLAQSASTELVLALAHSGNTMFLPILCREKWYKTK